MELDCQSYCHGGQADAGIVADLGQGFQRHVTTLQVTLVALLDLEHPDQAANSRLIGEDADHVGQSRDLAIEAFQRIDNVDPGPTLLRKSYVGQPIVLEVIHQSSDLRDALTNQIRHGLPLIMSRLLSLLREDGGDLGRAQPLGEALNRPLCAALRTGDQSATIEVAPHAAVGNEIFAFAF